MVEIYKSLYKKCNQLLFVIKTLVPSAINKRQVMQLAGDGGDSSFR